MKPGWSNPHADPSMKGSVGQSQPVKFLNGKHGPNHAAASFAGFRTPENDSLHDRIVRRKLSDEVFDRLKAFIAWGELQPGDEMPSERDLMEQFGVGRPAIREAMQQLSNMGL